MIKHIADEWSKYILDLLVELEVIRQPTIKEHIKPTHGSCCTCQDCGYYYDECVCSDNEIITKIQKRLREDWGIEDG